METLNVPPLDGLLYPSESDEPVERFTRDWPAAEPPQPAVVAALLDRPPGDPVTERDPARFWEPVTVEESWHGPEEQERTRRFTELKKSLETNLTHLKFFEVGETEVTLLLVGLHGP